MRVEFDITQNLIDGFAKSVNSSWKDDGFYIENAIIKDGGAIYLTFADELEFYHFKKAQFLEPLHMYAVNPTDTDWLMFHINLANTKQRKRAGIQEIEFHKYAPAGVLCYGPGIDIVTVIPANVDTEVCSIRFNKSFLKKYFSKDYFKSIRGLLYDDLDSEMENILLKALDAFDQPLLCHGLVLQLIHLFFKKIDKHEEEKRFNKIHSEDVSSIFKAAGLLRNPLQKEPPKVAHLAEAANMGITKFKSLFKQVFGKPPYKYHLKIRMEYAQEQLLNNGLSPTEISYQLGYAHPSNFTEAYKKHFGTLPSNL